MNLKKLSQIATNLREHVPVIGLPIADILFLTILTIAKIKNDWRREVDVLGQLALDVKRLADIFPFWQKFFLFLSLEWMTKCLDICADANTVIIYQTEIANCIIDILERNLAGSQRSQLVKKADDLLEQALEIAMSSYRTFVCRIDTKIARLTLLKTKADFPEASDKDFDFDAHIIGFAEQMIDFALAHAYDFFDNKKQIAHSSHIAEAKIVWAMIAEKAGDYPEALNRLRQALKYAEKESLVLRVKQIKGKIQEIEKLIS